MNPDQAFVDLYAKSPFGQQAREWLDRHRRMVAWNNAVITNTAAGYHAFLAQYPDSDLTLTARKLEERLKYRANNVAGPTASVSPPPATPAAAAAGATPQSTAPEAVKKAEKPEKPEQKHRRVERQAIPRARSPGYYGGGSYGGGSYGGGSYGGGYRAY